MDISPPAIDRLTRTDIRALQAERLQALLQSLVPANRFWTERLAAAGVQIDELQGPENLRLIPPVSKAEVLADQKAHPPYGSNLTYPLEAYSRMHQTSGTTGTPMRWLDTPESWECLMRSWGQLFQLMGLRRGDRLFFAFSFGPFLGFWAGFEGANRLGNLCIPAGGLSSQGRLQMLLENRATVLGCTPTYALRLIEVAAEQQIDLRASSVRAILVAGEPGGNIPSTRRRIEEAWGARVIDHWGMTELGPLAIEPEDRPGGLSVLETECIAEVIDPATGEPAPEGDEGELVITNLGRVGSPLIRYRTGDRVRAAPREPGATGSHALLYLPGGILGRTDDMLTIRGNNLYPAALEDALRGFPEVVEFRILVRTSREMQHVKIEVETRPDLSAEQLPQLVSHIAGTIKDRWHFQAEIVPVPANSLPRFEMKARRFTRIDER